MQRFKSFTSDFDRPETLIEATESKGATYVENALLYGGPSGFKRALKNAAMNGSLKQLVAKIDAPFLSRIEATQTINNIMREWNIKKGVVGKNIPDTRSHVLGLIHYAEEKLNRRILDSARKDTRFKREKEKSIVVDFFKKNGNQLKALFDIKNAVLEK